MKNFIKNIISIILTIILIGLILLGCLLLATFAMWAYSRYEFMDDCVAEGHSKSWCLKTWQEVDDL